MNEQINRRVSFVLQESHMIEAGKATMRRQIMGRPFGLVFLGLFAAAILVLMAIKGFEDWWLILIAAALALPIAYWLIMRFTVPWHMRRQVKQSAWFGEEMTAEWDNHGMRLSMERGDSRFAWGEFHAWMRLEKVLVLYQNEILFNLIPLAALGSAAADEIVANLESAGVRRR